MLSFTKLPSAQVAAKFTCNCVMTTSIELQLSCKLGYLPLMGQLSNFPDAWSIKFHYCIFTWKSKLKIFHNYLLLLPQVPFHNGT